MCSITALQCHIMVYSFKLVYKRQEMANIYKKYSSTHKTQLRFPPNSITSLQYFQFVLCNEIQHIENWHRYQHRSIIGYEKTILLH